MVCKDFKSCNFSIRGLYVIVPEKRSNFAPTINFELIVPN